MRKFLYSLLTSLILIQSSYAALTFGGASSDVANCGSGSSVDNVHAFTFMIWVNPNTISTNRRLFAKDSGAGGVGKSFTLRSTGQLDIVSTYGAGTNANARSNTGAGNILTTGKWWFVATTIDGSNNPTIYIGDQTTVIVQVASYATQIPGSGTPDDESANNFLVGNSSTAVLALQGDIAWYSYSSNLTLSQIQAIQYYQHIYSNMKTFTHFGGIMGTGTQPDWTGNGNTCSLTGTSNTTHPFAYCPYCKTEVRNIKNVFGVLQ